jgi:periplasmic divalent cation tolerance protein
MTDYLLVTTTVERREDADALARKLVEDRTAACVQVMGPIESTYRWRGSVEVAQEWLCLAKTTRASYADLERAILGLHPYETPEVVALPIVDGSTAYLEWLGEQVRDT